MGIAVLNRELEEFAVSVSQFPEFDTEVEDATEAARRHERRVRLWRSQTLSKLAKLKHLFQEAENDPSGDAVAHTFGPLRQLVLDTIDQSTREVSVRPRELDTQLGLIHSLGDASARMAASHINKVFNRAQARHLKYLGEIRAEIVSTFESVDVEAKVIDLTRETLDQFPVVNAYLAR